MHQDFDATLSEFLAKTRVFIDHHHGQIAEYERLLDQTQDVLLLHSQFVESVVHGLETIHLTSLKTKSKKDSVSNQETESETSVQPAKLEIAPKWETIEPKNILIVDDAEINRVLMGHIFKRIPVTLDFAVSGEQALGKIASKQFDLVLMDLQMKGMSGIEAIKRIRESQPENRDKTKIIAITTIEANDEERGLVMEAGANGYFSKGLPRETLREKVLEFLISASSPSA